MHSVSLHSRSCCFIAVGKSHGIQEASIHFTSRDSLLLLVLRGRVKFLWFSLYIAWEKKRLDALYFASKSFFCGSKDQFVILLSYG